MDADRLIISMEDLLRRTSGEAIDIKVVWSPASGPPLRSASTRERDPQPGDQRARRHAGRWKLTVETSNVTIDRSDANSLADAEPGEYVCVCVSDTGTGMSKDVIEKAFDPFFTTKPLGEGTGLGLSMVYGFARQSEGFVRIHSEVGEGTTVKIYLPKHRGDASVMEAIEELPDVQRGDGEIVLVVEDEPSVRDLVAEILRDLGYSVLLAHDGPSGLRSLDSSVEIDLLITDVGLPGLNGRQVADAARMHRPKLKVLFMTGYAENTAAAGGFLTPGMAMITKPFSVEVLASRIREIIATPN